MASAPKPVKATGLDSLRVGALEYLHPVYDKETLLKLAALFDSDAPVTSFHRYFVAECARQLAAKPAALRALNRPRPTTPRRILGLNRALHYAIVKRLRGKGKNKRALNDVARAWRVADKTIDADYSEFKDAARAPLAQLIRFRRGHRQHPDEHRWKRREIFEALDLWMQDRAKEQRATREK